MRIVFASDGSEGALAAGRLLASLAWPPDTALQIAVGADQGAEQVLARTREALGLFSGSIATTVLSGGGTHRTTEMLLSAAAAFGADLIVVGSRGHSALERFFLGSVAEALVRHADTPVLVVRPPVGSLRRVLLGADGSDLSRDAALWALEHLPLPPDCLLDLVQIAPSTVPLLSTDLATAPAALIHLEASLLEEERQAWTCVREMAQELSASGRYGARRFEGEACVGSPAVELVHLARERRADLVVVGSRGRGVNALSPLGSVAERVVRHAPCSVLVVRPARTATEREQDGPLDTFAFA